MLMLAVFTTEILITLLANDHMAVTEVFMKPLLAIGAAFPVNFRFTCSATFLCFANVGRATRRTLMLTACTHWNSAIGTTLCTFVTDSQEVITHSASDFFLVVVKFIHGFLVVEPIATRKSFIAAFTSRKRSTIATFLVAI